MDRYSDTPTHRDPIDDGNIRLGESASDIIQLVFITEEIPLQRIARFTSISYTFNISSSTECFLSTSDNYKINGIIFDYILK
jgi:hypothetical protein